MSGSASFEWSPLVLTSSLGVVAFLILQATGQNHLELSLFLPVAQVGKLRQGAVEAVGQGRGGGMVAPGSGLRTRAGGPRACGLSPAFALKEVSDLSASGAPRPTGFGIEILSSKSVREK